MTEIEVLDPATARHTTPVLIARAAVRAHLPQPRVSDLCRLLEDGNGAVRPWPESG